MPSGFLLDLCKLIPACLFPCLPSPSPLPPPPPSCLYASGSAFRRPCFPRAPRAAFAAQIAARKPRSARHAEALHHANRLSDHHPPRPRVVGGYRPPIDRGQPILGAMGRPS